MLEFTKALYELFGTEGMTLSKSLWIMKSKPKPDSISRAADAIYQALENGRLFSNALRSCTAIVFDDVYISFVSLAEKNGDLKTVLLYLKQKLERESDFKKKLSGAAVYPAFVVFLAVASSVFIGVYTGTSDYLMLAKYVFVLILACTGLYLGIAKLLKDNTLFEAFTAVDFLLQNGIELSEAVGCAVQIAGPSSRTGKLFENARQKLSYGMDLQNSFCGNQNTRFDSKLKEAFYYADAGAGKNNLFGRIADYLAAEKERSRTLWFSLIEPLFIVITGCFILMVLMTFFMPLINNFAWI